LLDGLIRAVAGFDQTLAAPWCIGHDSTHTNGMTKRSPGAAEALGLPHNRRGRRWFLALRDAGPAHAHAGRIRRSLMVFIGMDLHVRNSYLHVADEHGRRLKRGRIGDTMCELAAFLGPFENESMTVSLESTTNSRSMHQLLEQYGEQAGVDLTAQVLDARKLRIIAESANKNDKVDALH
jgi:hypothetical protein